MVSFIVVMACALLAKITQKKQVVEVESYPAGIVLNTVTYDDLKANGCTSCYSEYYSDYTTSANISSCSGPVLFVGSIKDGNPVYNLGAYDLASEVQTVTDLNKPHLSNDVYWYLTPGQ